MISNSIIIILKSLPIYLREPNFQLLKLSFNMVLKKLISRRILMITNVVLENIKNRRSIRKFKPEQIKQEELETILEVAIYAPTGHNDQPWHFTIIQDPDVIQHISDKSNEIMAQSEIEWISKMGKKNRHLLYNAPTVIVVSGKEGTYSPLTDCSAAIQNMLLAAESLNVGSLWNGLVEACLNIEEETKALNIPEGYKPYYAICLGYKDCEQPSVLERHRDVFTFIK